MAGKKTVRIRGSRELPPRPEDGPDAGPMYEDYIPARHNTGSTLTIEVKPGEDNTYEFKLTP